MTSQREQKLGLIYALASFVSWGITPIYFKALSHVLPVEILCHRILWSVPFLAILISASRGWGTLVRAAQSRKVMLTLLLTSCLVAGNWFIFIYAISANQLLQASLGYFVTPLLNVCLGMMFLGERLRPWQWVSVVLAVAGTANLAMTYAGFPWIALGLALTFSIYGLLRKTVAIEAMNGLFIETTLLAVPALACLLYLFDLDLAAFGTVDWSTTWLLVAAGAITSLPLAWFTAGARRLRYSTVGLFQYISPSLQFSLAVFAFGEPFTSVYVATFGLIWTGLVIFVADSLADQRRTQRALSQPNSQKPR